MTVLPSGAASEKVLRRPAAFVFDFDGTLAVPTLDFALMKRRALSAFHQFALFPGESSAPLMEQLAAVCAALDSDSAHSVRKAVLAVVEEVEVEAAGRSSLFPFVRPMLEAFRRRDVPFAIITRNCPAAVRAVFPDVDAHCPCLLTRDDVANVKPHPEHLERALAVLGCMPEDTLMVGDHPMDIAVGHAVGTLTAGVCSGESDRERLACAKPTFLAADVGELAHMLGIME